MQYRSIRSAQYQSRAVIRPDAITAADIGFYRIIIKINQFWNYILFSNTDIMIRNVGDHSCHVEYGPLIL